MAFKSFFNKITTEIGNEITNQLTGGSGSRSQAGGSSSGGGAAPGFNMEMVGDLIGLLKGGGGSAGGGGNQTGIQKMLRAIQKYGGILPGDADKYIPGILKIAEIFGHGLGDDTPRTERASDGSIIDDFLKTLISGRKIFGGGGKGKVVKDTISGGDGGGGGSRYRPEPMPEDMYDGGVSSAQDIDDIRAKCLQAGSLFEDSEFPAVDSSVFFSRSSRRTIYWKRPHEIDSNPQFFVDGASRFDVMQGELGDCWLLAAVANLTMNEATFRSVVPADNTFADGEYCGAFHFRFWQYGK